MTPMAFVAHSKHLVLEIRSRATKQFFFLGIIKRIWWSGWKCINMYLQQLLPNRTL